jgi:RNA polymerase sigma-70 factor (ECF subfamily)
VRSAPVAEDDDRLAERSRRGDAAALAALYRRHAGGLVAYLERFLGDRGDAEDVLQDTFVRIFEGRGRYRGSGRFRAWLFTIATRLARDRVKQRQRRAELLRAGREAPPREPDPLSLAVVRQVEAIIDSVLADLPSTYASAYHLRVREGFSYREMAEICGDPEGTLRSRVHHTLKRIRDELPRRKSDPERPQPQEEDSK